MDPRTATSTLYPGQKIGARRKLRVATGFCCYRSPRAELALRRLAPPVQQPRTLPARLESLGEPRPVVTVDREQHRSSIDSRANHFLTRQRPPQNSSGRAPPQRDRNLKSRGRSVPVQLLVASGCGLKRTRSRNFVFGSSAKVMANRPMVTSMKSCVADCTRPGTPAA